MKNKDKILDIIKESSCGVTASNIFLKMQKEVDKTTIYRNLEKLINDGIILSDFDSSGEKHYSFSETHHHHFICDRCGETEFIGCFINPEIKKLESSFGFEVKNHSFTLNGICKDCL